MVRTQIGADSLRAEIERRTRSWRSAGAPSAPSSATSATASSPGTSTSVSRRARRVQPAGGAAQRALRQLEGGRRAEPRRGRAATTRSPTACASLATRIGEPYFEIPSPVELAVEHGLVGDAPEGAGREDRRARERIASVDARGAAPLARVRSLNRPGGMSVRARARGAGWGVRRRGFRYLRADGKPLRSRRRSRASTRWRSPPPGPTSRSRRTRTRRSRRWATTPRAASSTSTTRTTSEARSGGSTASSCPSRGRCRGCGEVTNEHLQREGLGRERVLATVVRLMTRALLPRRERALRGAATGPSGSPRSGRST